MAINGLSIAKDSTGITVTAGTATVFTDDGLDVKNGIHIVDSSVTSYTERPHATFKNKVPTLLANGQYGKGKRDINLTLPKTTAAGDIVFPVFRGTFEIHPEQTVAEITEFRRLVAQLIIDGELDDFYVYGSIR